jgi:hypothetical protein
MKQLNIIYGVPNIFEVTPRYYSKPQVIIDLKFSLQCTVDVDFALRSLHRVKVNIADVSEVHTTSIFRV